MSRILMAMSAACVLATVTGCGAPGRGISEKGASEPPPAQVEGSCQYGDPASCYDPDWCIPGTDGCPEREEGTPVTQKGAD